MPVIDFHSHFLPGIDDGSRDLDTSIKILSQASGQGVEWMIATPHFYAMHDRISAFLERRDAAYAKLQECFGTGMPKIMLGAEVAFFRGISRAENIESLTIGDTGVLLLELPFEPWSSVDIDEVRVLAESRGISVLLAHLERYMEIPENKRMIPQLLELPLTVQINAGSLLDWRRRGKLIRMFRDDVAHVLGSDCHGMHRRPPNLSEGRWMLGKKLGQDFLDKMDRYGSELLKII